MVGGAYNSVGWRKSWEDWQAAIQHARDVAVKVCEERAGSVSMFSNAREARDHNATVRGCADAIKEALK